MPPTEKKSTPEKDVEELEKTHRSIGKQVKKAIGVTDNTLIIGVEAFSKLLQNLGWLYAFGFLLAVPLYFYRIYSAITTTKEPTPARYLSQGVKIASAIGSLSLAVLTAIVTVGLISIATPILILAGAIKSVAENTWELSKAIYQRISKGTAIEKQIADLETKIRSQPTETKNKLTPHSPDIIKLTDLYNEKNKLNAKIANKAHLLAISVTAVIGAVLLFTPLAPIGVGILIGTAAYGIADALNLNPLKWIAGHISKKLKSPFAQKTPEEVLNAMQEPGEKLAKKATPEAVKQMAIATPHLTQPIHNSETDVFKKIKTNKLSDLVASVKNRLAKKTSSSQPSSDPQFLQEPTQTIFKKPAVIEIKGDKDEEGRGGERDEDDEGWKESEAREDESESGGEEEERREKEEQINEDTHRKTL